MSRIPVDNLREDRLRCPTCRAQQEWSDTCRRCKCDLTLLRDLARACLRQRRLCWTHLRAGCPRQALPHARRYYHGWPCPQALRLLAVCQLLCGQWPAALTLAQSSSE